VEDAFGTLVFVVAAVGAVVAIFTLAGTARSYRQIGSGGLTHDGQDAPAQPAVDAGLRDEVHDLVVAGNQRRVRAGKEPLDVETEVQRRIRHLN
jgi:hypothetical protein